MWTRAAWTPARVALALAGLVLLLLVLAQLVLPSIAARAVRKEIGDDHAKVSIRAFPAVKLLFGHANSLTVDTPTVTPRRDAPLGELLRRAKKIGRTDATVGRVQVQGLRLSDVHAHVRDGRVTADAALSVRALSALVPGGGALRAQPPQSDGRPRFVATVGVLGVTTDVPVVVSAVDGTVQVAPDGGLASLISITVFQDPSLDVDSVTGAVSGDTLRIRFSGSLN